MRPVHCRNRDRKQMKSPASQEAVLPRAKLPAATMAAPAPAPPPQESAAPAGKRSCSAPKTPDARTTTKLSAPPEKTARSAETVFSTSPNSDCVRTIFFPQESPRRYKPRHRFPEEPNCCRRPDARRTHARREAQVAEST